MILKIFKNKKEGFTLIESVLYLALSSIILGLALLMLYSLIQYRAKDKIRRDVDGEVLRTIDFISQNVRNAKTIEIRDNSNNPITSGYGQKLYLQTENINNTSYNMTIYLDQDKIKINKNLTVTDLNGDIVKISNLRFRYLTGNVTGDAGIEVIEANFTAEYSLTVVDFFKYTRNVSISIKSR